MKILILIGLVKLLTITDKPFQCAIIYTVIQFLFGLMLGHSFFLMLIVSVIGLSLSSLYFWLLWKTADTTIWLIIAIGGLLIGLV